MIYSFNAHSAFHDVRCTVYGPSSLLFKRLISYSFYRVSSFLFDTVRGAVFEFAVCLQYTYGDIGTHTPFYTTAEITAWQREGSRQQAAEH